MGRNGQESIGKGVNCVAISRSHGCQQKSRKAKPNYDFSTSNHLEFDLVSEDYEKLRGDFILDELRYCVFWLSNFFLQNDPWELINPSEKEVEITNLVKLVKNPGFVSEATTAVLTKNFMLYTSIRL